MAITGPTSQPIIPQDSENKPALANLKNLPVTISAPPQSTGRALLRASLNIEHNKTLFATAEKLKNLPQAKAIQPKAGIDSDVYINTDSVFKPDEKGEDTIRAILCSDVAALLGLEKSVPSTIEAVASFAMSSSELDENGEPIVYEAATVNNEQWLVNPHDELSIKRYDESTGEFKLRDKSSGTLKNEGDGKYSIVKFTDAVNEDEPALEPGDIVLIADLGYGKNIVKLEDARPVSTDSEGSPHVVHEGKRFELTRSQANVDDSDELSDEERYDAAEDEINAQDPESTSSIPDSAILIRKDVKGLLQQKIQDAFTDLDINNPRSKKAVADFFNKIDPSSFIDSMMLAVLFRTQDGRASNLSESNFLFTLDSKTDKYTIALIDFDETWPTENGIRSDTESKEKGDITTLRLGLMGFPQAHQELQGAEKNHLLDILESIKKKNSDLLHVVADSSTSLKDGTKVTKAFEELTQRLIDFYDTKKERSFSLADIVFHVFPEYHDQWQKVTSLVEDRNVNKGPTTKPTEEQKAVIEWWAGDKIRTAAENIGFASIQEIEKRIVEQKNSAEKNKRK